MDAGQARKPQPVAHEGNCPIFQALQLHTKSRFSLRNFI